VPIIPVKCFTDDTEGDRADSIKNQPQKEDRQGNEWD